MCSLTWAQAVFPMQSLNLEDAVRRVVKMKDVIYLEEKVKESISEIPACCLNSILSMGA